MRLYSYVLTFPLVNITYYQKLFINEIVGNLSSGKIEVIFESGYNKKQDDIINIILTKTDILYTVSLQRENHKITKTMKEAITTLILGIVATTECFNNK